MTAGCSFIMGATDIFFNRDAADFEGSGKIGKYETSFTGHVNLKEFPKFGVLGIFPKVKNIAKDITSGFTDWGKREVKKVKAKIQKIERAKDATKKALENEKNNLKHIYDKEVNAKRKEITIKIRALSTYANARIKDNKRHPVRKKAWEKVKEAADKIKFSKDGFSIDGITEIRTALQGATDMVKKLPSKVGAKVRNAITAEINKIKGDVDAVSNMVSGLKDKINNLPSVKKARARVDKAQKEFDKARTEVSSAVLDPVLDTIDQATTILVIEKVGFDSGLEALCKKQLPRLTVAGKYKGQPFTIQNAVALPLNKKTDYSELRDKLLNVIKK
jgi:predicted transcriptional regulator